MMKPLKLNFSHQAERRQQRRNWTVLVLSLLLLVFIGREALTIQRSHESQVMKRTEQSRVLQMTTVVDPEQQKLAQSVADSLNLPWYELLEALESVKQQHPEVYLREVLPDASRQQVVISGDVKQLGALLAYIDSLNQHRLFSDALLVSQQQAVPVSNGMAFSLKVLWRHE